MCVAPMSVSRFYRCFLVLVAVLLLNTLDGLCCVPGGMGYRNFWVELYSTTPCGDVGAAPIGVCSMATTCSVMNGEALGTYNCPVTSSTCCRPVATCDATTVALNLLWESEDYATTSQLQPSHCTLNVVPSSDTCYIRVDFEDMDIESISVDSCGYSYLRINGQDHGDSQKICGTLNHKTTFVKVGTHLTGLPAPIEFNLRMGHAPHKYSAKFNHVKCSDVRKFRSSRRHRSTNDVQRSSNRRRSDGKELGYMGRLYAVSYTREPLIRSCPVTFISEDIVIGPASCTLRLGGPGISKGLMVVHGALAEQARGDYPKTVGSLARYVANNGVVVKSTVFHPMYNHETHEHDMALYFLNKTVQTVTPVMLPVPIDDFVELSVFMARYNYHDVSNDVTIMSDPEEVVTKVVSNSECNMASIPRVALISSNDTICIAPTPRDNAPCSGEVGSPIVHIGGSGAITLLGLMMGGYHHCDGKHSYAEPAIKIINYLDFIDVATSPSFTVPRPSTPGSTLTRWYSNLWG